MLKNKDECKNHDPIYETYLHGFNSDIVFNIHYLLEFFVSFLYLTSCINNVEVNPIENCALLND